MDRALRAGTGEIPKVAVLIETTNSVRRDLVLGISRYARLNGPWSLRIASCKDHDIVPKMKNWGASGIITPVPNATIEEALIAARLPTIVIDLKPEHRSSKSPLFGFSELTFDAAKTVAKLAAEHFAERQFHNFAFVGVRDVAWSDRREIAFVKQVGEMGFEAAVYRQPVLSGGRAWAKEQVVLSEWIQRLPMPVGILACNDERGGFVLECCRSVKIPVPEKVAVLGVDNDEIFCSITDPPLSSVAIGTENAGYKAANLLNSIMRGEIQEPRQIDVEAVGVVARRSTDTAAVNDAEIAAALKFIREQSGKQLVVTDVADAVLVSRRALEKRFRQVLGRTILDEIQNTRIETAKRLLLETKHSIATIATMAGFGTTNYFVRFFRQRVGKSPSEFRGERLD